MIQTSRDLTVTRAALAPPIYLPGTGQWPLLLSVPHAGTNYPEWLLRESRQGRPSLEPLEDPLVNRLVWRAAGLGIGVVVACAPRAAVDCNRGPHEMEGPAAMGAADPGPRARGGLGLIPSRTPRHGELWKHPVSADEIDRRMAEAWLPYHELVANQLGKLRVRHAEVMLLDVHSMPARSPLLPRLVIGDRHGRTASAWLGDLTRRTAESLGYRTAFNDPYAGGHVVEQHGRPAAGVHALQLELDRACYLGRDQRTPGKGFDGTARMLEAVARTLGEALLARAALPEAAE
ncbi:N-formylglutamate amidohydrolase [Sphingomonas sp. BN140010]|uniref:N-formylglutamate amidohydrolase n=1 Tax=Sphingomonas arvum TaxID=2992113 RepID=A0ABT3JE66_9SPHN|nr:N-formylglutamate amidohydrolase [Sphingomonas sp. BN140010]MCW3797348.1 N-formylglutamate amidohydrolase [Sphingomonas sp. BN140010]